ncbi:hypothetical protein Ahy_A02g005579 [Arachis hypogaea]|uniref:AT-hook motif nuclear-localized protein n=1 Tax=Arachis hypogaea TaxID=3818 RepID=A0A445E7A1_ARAHY|nr:hypothetical protein Ahy_A02g005579 [Arachis hypogaea]
MAETLSTSVFASMASLSSPKQAQELAMMSMKVETNAGATPPPPLPPPQPIAVATMATTSGSLENKKLKKKRGRPRKYDPNGIMGLTCPPNAESMAFASPQQSHFGEVANLDGVGFTPHVVNLHAGEDVAAKIMSFVEKYPGGICVLSANGAISSVTLDRSGSSGGLWTYELTNSLFSADKYV